MSRFRDLLGVAWTGLSARKVRTLLIMLGPIVGVAAMVGAVGSRLKKRVRIEKSRSS